MKNKKDKKIILTFDYELALGSDSGTAKKCVIEPTDKILSIFKKHKARGIFFIDATYLLTLKKYKHKDYKAVKENIQKIIGAGNDIGLHLHPQWLDAYPLDDNRWSFKSFDKYRLHDLKDIEIERLFYEGRKILEGIAGEVKKNYKIDSFRAGGWAIQPFQKLKKSFLINKILFDFSVNPGLSSDTGAFGYYDFKKAPKVKIFWSFSEDVCEVSQNGSFVEVAVSTTRVWKLKLLLNYYLFKKNEREIGDGKYISNPAGKKNIFKKIFVLLKIFSKPYASLSIDGLHFDIFKSLLNKKERTKMEYLTFVAHPKKLSDSSEKIIEYLAENYITLSLDDIRGIAG